MQIAALSNVKDMGEAFSRRLHESLQEWKNVDLEVTHGGEGSGEDIIKTLTWQKSQYVSQLNSEMKEQEIA